jgi:leucyl-tRNA synthetase
VYCDKCGIVPVPENELPVKLPEKVKFGKGNPLATNKEFIEVKCPRCHGKAKRETDTMDTFFDSSWYYLRYCDAENKNEPFAKEKIKYWMPVDQYIGGAEHACMHLIYARFFTKALRDMGFLKIDEPFAKLFNQGMLLGADGNKMSKSLGNVIVPEEVSKKYGIDTARLFLVSVASPDKDFSWSDEGIEGSFRIINRIARYFSNIKPGKSSAAVESKVNKAIKEVTGDIENFRYNFAAIKLRALFESLESEEVSKKDLEVFLKLLHPFCPHITEELWHTLGNKNFISLEKWPAADEKKINEKLDEEEKKILQAIEDANRIFRIIREKQAKEPRKIYFYTLPKELEAYRNAKAAIEKSLNVPVEVFAVNDKSKHDPEGKASKAQPGKPAIYVE